MKTVIILFSLLLLTPSAFAEKIVIAADQWCPFNCIPDAIRKDSERPGFIVEFAQYSFGKAGHDVKYIEIPWARTLRQVAKDNPEVNGAIGAFKGDAPDFIFPENEQSMATMPFFAKKGSSWKYTDVSSLRNIKVGAIRNYSYGEDVDAYIADKANKQRVQIVNTLGSLVTLVDRGKIQAFSESRIVLKYYLKQIDRPPTDFVEVGVASEEKAYIAFSPTHPKSKMYAKILSDGMVEMRNNGTLAEILKKYDLKDWK